MPSISARSAKAVCLVVVAAGSMAACSGGDDDGPEATPETDAIALVVAATEENPRALPSGVTYDRLRFASVPEYGAGASEDLVAVLEMEFHGRSSQYLAEVTVLRTESAARASLMLRLSSRRCRRNEERAGPLLLLDERAAHPPVRFGWREYLLWAVRLGRGRG